VACLDTANVAGNKNGPLLGQELYFESISRRISYHTAQKLLRSGLSGILHASQAR